MLRHQLDHVATMRSIEQGKKSRYERDHAFALMQSPPAHPDDLQRLEARIAEQDRRVASKQNQYNTLQQKLLDLTVNGGGVGGGGLEPSSPSSSTRSARTPLRGALSSEKEKRRERRRRGGERDVDLFGGFGGASRKAGRVRPYSVASGTGSVVTYDYATNKIIGAPEQLLHALQELEQNRTCEYMQESLENEREETLPKGA